MTSTSVQYAEITEGYYSAIVLTTMMMMLHVTVYEETANVPGFQAVERIQPARGLRKHSGRSDP